MSQLTDWQPQDKRANEKLLLTMAAITREVVRSSIYVHLFCCSTLTQVSGSLYDLKVPLNASLQY
jgi:hypothetical protein